MARPQRATVQDVAAAGKTVHVIDVLVIVTSVLLIGLAVWPGDPTASTEASIELGSAQYAWAAQFLAGGLGIVGMWHMQRRRGAGLARLCYAGAIVFLLAGFVIAREYDWRAWLLLALPGAIFVLAAFLSGPLPPPVAGRDTQTL